MAMDDDASQPPDDGPSAHSEDFAADAVDLRRSITALSHLVMGHGRQGLETSLTQIAEFAVRAVPGADGAGLTLMESGHPDTIVASADFVRAVDAIQYGIGEGPCISAADQRRTVVCGSLSTEGQWPRFGPRVARLGVHSALSLPLVADDAVLGAMNIYAHARDAFDERAIELGELFAVPAAISVHNAQVLAQTGRLAEQLQAALTSRSAIDQALGIVMSRTGCSEDEAFDRLRAMSQADNRKLADVAHRLIDEAVHRARARARRTPD
jgi:GAF domain-containing protein